MLRSLLQIAATLALIAIGGGVAVLSRDAHRLLIHADATMRHVDGGRKRERSDNCRRTMRR